MCMVVEVRAEPKQAVTAYFVARHILLPATIYAGFYSTYCRPLPHIVTDDDICGNSCVFGGGARAEKRQTDGADLGEKN